LFRKKISLLAQQRSPPTATGRASTSQNKQQASRDMPDIIATIVAKN
jgi:hypothetical protein